MFQIKICGITRVEDAVHVTEAGADAIGLNFFASSKRYVPLERAQEIATVLPQGVARVGVFVNSSLTEITEIADAVSLDWIQLHGDEPLDWINRLSPLRVVRAIRWSDQSVADLVKVYGDCGAAAVLVDAHASGHYGGTGKVVDWAQAGQLAADLPIPLILAGGLRPENVVEAIRTALPAGVDTASGVEAAPGRKDRELTKQFVEAALRAFAKP